MKRMYGHFWEDNEPQEAIELGCIAMGLPPVEEHMLQALRLLLSTDRLGENGIVITPWTEERVRIFARHMRGQEREGKYIAVWGPAAAGKTVDFAAISLVYWLADPCDTIVVCASTSKGMLSRKIWGVMRGLYLGLGEPFGKVSDGDYCIRAARGAKQGGIYGIAVWGGDMDKALANIYGTHARRVLVVVDEAQGASKRIIDTRPNLLSGSEEFMMVLIGNPTGITTPLGEYSEPVEGWQALTMERTSWPTKKNGWVYWFDGLSSPAIAEPRKYRWLIGAKHIESIRESYGEASAQYLTQARGFMPLCAYSNALFSDEFVVRSRMNLERFESNECAEGVKIVIAKYAGFDPSITGYGDMAAYQFVDLVRLADNSVGLEFHDAGEIKIQVSDEPVVMQMAGKFLDEVMRQGVPFHNCGVDSTTVQAVIPDVCDMLIAQRLGTKAAKSMVHRVSFISRGGIVQRYLWQQNQIQFANLITEMYWVLYELAKRQRVRGLSTETISELMSRPIDMRRGRWQLEPKNELRKRGLSSPNRADAVLICMATICRDYGVSILSDGGYSFARTPRIAIDKLAANDVDILDVKV